MFVIVNRAYVAACILMMSLLFPYGVFADDSKGVAAIYVLGTIGGASYNPQFSRVVDSATSNTSLFWVDPQISGISLKSFDGFGVALDIMGVIGGNFYIDADLVVQYRNDNENNNTGANQNFLAPQIYNQVISFAVDIGYTGGGGEGSYFGWYASVGFGIASDNIQGQYPAYGNKNFPLSTDPTKIDYYLSKGLTELYYSDVQFTFYYGQFRAGVEIKPGKSKSGGSLAIGYRGMYSQEMQIPKENVPTITADLPTTIATAVKVNGTGTPSNAPIIQDNVTPPLYAANRYYIQGQTFRSNIIEIGVRWSFN